MVPIFTRFAAWRHACQVLLLLALAFNAAIPAGFMPGMSKGGTGPSLVICTSNGALSFGADDLGGKEPHDHTSDHSVCAFASHSANGVVVSLDAADLIGDVSYSVLPATIVPTLFVPARAAQTAPLPPRGPPGLAA